MYPDFRASARGTTRQYYFNLTPKALSLTLSRGLELFFWIRIIFSSAAPSLVQASSFCKKLPASYVFTATFLKFIKLLHVLIGQSIQPSDRDVRDGEDCDDCEDCDIRNGGSCGIRDGDALSGVRDCSSFMGSSILQGLVCFICVYSYPLKIILIQLLHVLIGQSFQSSARDVWDGGACSARDGGARGGCLVGGACVVRDGGSCGGVRGGEVHGVSFLSAAPSLVLASSLMTCPLHTCLQQLS